MRKALFIALFCVAAIAVKAQTLDASWSYTFTTDTITNAEADTLLLPADFVSPWSYTYSIVVDSLSGTDTLSFVLQESASKSGNTDWVTVSTGAGSELTSPLRTTTALMYGRRARIIVRGSGTQSTTYAITFLAKKIHK